MPIDNQFVDLNPGFNKLSINVDVSYKNDKVNETSMKVNQQKSFRFNKTITNAKITDVCSAQTDLRRCSSVLCVYSKIKQLN